MIGKGMSSQHPLSSSGNSGSASAGLDMTEHAATPPFQTAAAPQWTPQQALDEMSDVPTFSPSPSSPIPFLHLLQRLKTTPREGWRRFEIPHPESIADHMYRMSIICLIAPKHLHDKIDVGHCVQLALVHDMAESVVGDITPVDKPEVVEDKTRRERETMKFFANTALAGVDQGWQGERLRGLWEEYEAGKTEEARFVKDVDKLELVLQMVEYEREGGSKVDLGEFLRVRDNIKGEVCMAWVEELVQEREAMWNGWGKKAKGMKGYVEPVDKKEEDKAEVRDGEDED